MTQAKQAITFHHPPGCRSERNDRGGYLVTPPGSRAIALEERLGRLWQMADGLTPAELTERAGDYPHWREAIHALRLAGLLHPPVAPARSPAPIPDAAPLVSVIIPTHNGRHHLAECLPSVQAQSYPNVEIIVVDDHSTDGSAAYLQAEFPDVHCVSLETTANFSASCNLGARHARGEYYFFLNNDTVLDEHCLRELIATQQQSENVGGVAAMMRLYHHPAFINGLGTRQRRLGFGYDIGIGSLDVGQFDDVEEVPAVCFGAALIARTAWQQVGPLDERYGFYYEDADWSYRARLQGLRLVPAPHALVFHKFSASMKEKPSAFKIRLATRNRLWFAAKNLPAAEALLQLGLYWLDDQFRSLKALLTGQWTMAWTILLAWLSFYRGLPSVLQARRRSPRQHAVDLEALARPFPLPLGTGDNPFLTEELIATRYLPFLQSAPGSLRQRLLIISPDAVHSRMGGVGIRYWELARQLAPLADVTLASPRESDLESELFAIRSYREENSSTLRPLAEGADIILLSGFTVYHHPFLRTHPAYKVVDLYDPMILENLERFSDKPMSERQGLHNVGVNTFNQLFALGDFFICASEKQRDYWLGALTAANRVNPLVYEADPTLQRLIDVVPFGLPAEPPHTTRRVLKGVWPGIGPDDKVVLWGGGLWDWLDPLTVIEAMPAVLESVPEARLFFLGTRHPNPAVPESQMARQAIALAEALALKDRAIFFNDWTPYEERVNYLCEADVGVSLHGEHVETRFAVRTRLMDYLWARLPMVVGGGDVLGDLVASHGLGHVVAARDRSAVAKALTELLQDPVDPERFDPVIHQFYWENVSAPLKSYVQAPWRNAAGGLPASINEKVAGGMFRRAGKALTILRRRGPRGLIQESIGYVRWILQH